MTVESENWKIGQMKLYQGRQGLEVWKIALIIQSYGLIDRLIS